MLTEFHHPVRGRICSQVAKAESLKVRLELALFPLVCIFTSPCTGAFAPKKGSPAASGAVYVQRSKSTSADNSTPAQMQPMFAPFPGCGPHRSSAVLWLRVSRAGVFAQRRPIYLARRLQEVCPHATVLNVGCFGGTS